VFLVGERRAYRGDHTVWHESDEEGQRGLAAQKTCAAKAQLDLTP
jgi:hypothetical protein